MRALTPTRQRPPRRHRYGRLRLRLLGLGPASSSAAAPASAASAPAAAAGPCAAGAAVPPSRVPGAPLDTVLRVLPRARGHRAPLVLALHFAGGTASEMEEATRLTPEARRDGFVVAYPERASSRCA